MLKYNYYEIKVNKLLSFLFDSTFANRFSLLIIPDCIMDFCRRSPSRKGALCLHLPKNSVSRFQQNKKMQNEFYFDLIHIFLSASPFPGKRPGSGRETERADDRKSIPPLF